MLTHNWIFNWIVALEYTFDMHHEDIHHFVGTLQGLLKNPEQHVSVSGDYYKIRVSGLVKTWPKIEQWFTADITIRENSKQALIMPPAWTSLENELKSMISGRSCFMKTTFFTYRRLAADLRGRITTHDRTLLKVTPRHEGELDIDQILDVSTFNAHEASTLQTIMADSHWLATRLMISAKRKDASIYDAFTADAVPVTGERQLNI